MTKPNVPRGLAVALLFGAGVVTPSARPAGQASPAAAALQRGDFAVAEHMLRAELAVHPNDAMTLSLLGVALDSEKEPQQADTFHRRAAALAPYSVPVLTNFAAHLWYTGDRNGARSAYARIASLEPDNYGANLQLAQIALQTGRPLDAVRFLDRMDTAKRQSPEALLVLLEALSKTSDEKIGASRAEAALARLTALASADPRLAFSIGSALAGSGAFARADLFSKSRCAPPRRISICSTLSA